MAFDALEVSIQLCAALRAPLERLRQHDRDLCDQARRAGKDRLHLLRIAAGSAHELATALRLAHAWGYLDPASLGQPLALLDRVQAMLWRLSH